MPSNNLSILFLIVYITGIVGLGIWNRKSKNSEDYFLASRNLPAWLLAITFIASWWGGGSAIDLVDHAHKNGLNSFWIYGVPVLLATALMYVFAKGIRNIGTISQPQLMKQRYNSKVALLLSLFIIIFMIIAASIQVIVVGKFFQAFFEISYTKGAMLGAGIVLTYSMFGGFRGVVLTDLLQFLFFLIAGLFLLYFTFDLSGGMQAVKTTAISKEKTGYTSFFHNVGDQLAYVITFGTSWMIQANIWQRISAAKNAIDAKKMMLYSFFAFIPLYLMVTYTGMFTSVIYDTVPESGIVPNMVSTIPNPIIGAFIFVGLSAAIMSTMDSLINTGALSLTVDIYEKYINPKATSKQNVVVGRLSTLIMTILALLIALKIKSVLKISWIGSDFLTSGAFIPLVFGFLWVKGTSKAAFISMLFGLFFSTYNMLTALGAPFPTAWEIASTEQAIIGISASLIIYFSVSLLTKDDYEKNKRFIKKANVFGK